MLALMDVREHLLRVIDALNAAGIPYAICGGLAVVIHGYLRLTDDIDLLVLPRDLAAAKKALQSAGFGLANPEPIILPGRKEGRCVIHRLICIQGNDHLVLDLIEATPSLETVWNDRQEYRWEGRPIFAVSRQGLIQMKRAAGRPQDVADIENLSPGKSEPHG